MGEDPLWERDALLLMSARADAGVVFALPLLSYE